MNQLLQKSKVIVVAAAAVAGTSDITTDVIDMSGYENIAFIALTGDVTATSVLTLTGKGNTANSTSSPTPVTIGATTAFTAGAADADSKAITLDITKPKQRYVFAVLSRTTANAVLGGIIAILYDGRVKPSTDHATVIASNSVLGASV